jgi:hypothetical protein
MAKTYRPTAGDRLANAVIGSLLRVGLGPSFLRLLTVTGRTTGQPRTTPVVPRADRSGALARGAVRRGGLGAQRTCSGQGDTAQGASFGDADGHRGLARRGRPGSYVSTSP